jgi:two-component system response regulator HydG
VPLLAAHFLERFNRRTGGDKALTAEGAARLLEHDWPGNVRELENVIEQAAALSPIREIRAQDVHLIEPVGTPTPGAPATLARAVEETERRVIEAALHRHQHDLPQVARELGVSGTTLWRKMRRLGIEAREPPGTA